MICSPPSTTSKGFPLELAIAWRRCLPCATTCRLWSGRRPPHRSQRKQGAGHQTLRSPKLPIVEPAQPLVAQQGLNDEYVKPVIAPVAGVLGLVFDRFLGQALRCQSTPSGLPLPRDMRIAYIALPSSAARATSLKRRFHLFCFIHTFFLSQHQLV